MADKRWESSNPLEMVACLRERHPDLLTERKARLFALACCYKFEDRIPQDCWSELEILEQYLDGHASSRKLRNADMRLRHTNGGRDYPGRTAAGLVEMAVSDQPADIIISYSIHYTEAFDTPQDELGALNAGGAAEEYKR